MNNESRLKYFPISFFSIILGLSGLTIAMSKMELLFGLGLNISLYLLIGTIFIFAILLLTYFLKFISFKEEVLKEFKSQVKVSFFATISVSFLLLSVALLDVNMVLSKYFWIIGVIIHTFFTYVIISFWVMHPNFDIKHFNPAWFIPVVGNILIPVGGIKHFIADISWFYYSIGFIFWIVLFAIFIYRIIFHHPLPEKLMPTLAILIAPPAVGFIAYVKLTGSLDSFAKVMYYFALFLFTFLLREFKTFSKLKFYLSWWAYSFPISSMAIATVLMFSKTKVVFYKYLALTLVIFLVGIIVMLIPKTINAMKNKQICVEE